MTESTWLPNFFIAGVPKAGTSALHKWIADHPDALAAREKETYFFVDPETHMFDKNAHFTVGFESYKDQFRNHEGKDYKIIFESTPSYVYSQTALAQIPNLPSRPRCLFLVREPASQMMSIYTYFKNNWNWIPDSMSFADFIATSGKGTHTFKGNELAQNAVRNARFVDHLRPWRDALGSDRMMVATYDSLKEDPRGFAKEVAQWLGLDPEFYDTYAFGRENETYVPRNRLLQRVNIAVRNIIPKGRGYDALRALYRKLNTTSGSSKADYDAAIMADLRADFADKNAELAKEFNLDLSGWH